MTPIRPGWRQLLIAICILSAFSCGGGGSPSTPVSASSVTPSAVVTISNFNVTPEISGSGRIYRTSFTMNETSGRAAATITTIRFTLGAGVADANPTSPLRIAAGGSVPSGTININDSSGAAITSIGLAVGYSDEGGRSSSVSNTATFSVPSAPVAASRITIAGVVTDASTGLPIVGATVTGINVLVNTNARSATDGAGYYSLPNVAAGEFVNIDWTATGYVSQAAREIFNQDTRRDIRLSRQVITAPIPAGCTSSDPPFTWDSNVQRCRNRLGQFAQSVCCGR